MRIKELLREQEKAQSKLNFLTVLSLPAKEKQHLSRFLFLVPILNEIAFKIIFVPMTNKDRQAVYNKYEGRCAYCGCELTKGWHTDHLKPVRRSVRKNGKYRYPNRDCFENCMPACASCNINIHQMSLEDFRKLISGFMKHLNERNTQYKIAKRYGLVQEVDKEIKFYFEKQVDIDAMQIL